MAPKLIIVCLGRDQDWSSKGDWLPAFERRLAGDDDLGALVTLIQGFLPTVSSEIREVIKVDSQTALYSKITAPTLLMVGNKSPSILQPTITALAAVLPAVQIERFPTLDHGAPNTMPAALVPVLKAFFDPGVQTPIAA